MHIQDLKYALPNYAKDIKLNLSSVLTEEGAPGLTQQQIYMIGLTSAYTTQNPILMATILDASSKTLSDVDITAAKAAATIMAMNNIYYRFIHLVDDKEYNNMSANLRMSVIGRPGVEKLNFELMSLAVSAINGCSMCIKAHKHEAVKAGINKIAVQSTIRIAAVMSALAQTIAIEKFSESRKQPENVA